MTRPDREVLAAMIDGLQHAREPLRSQQLTLFAARAGTRQQGDLLVVGRAVNGGDISFKISELSDSTRGSSLLNDLAAESTPEGSDPMGWVGRDWSSRDRHKTRRSQFWRVVRKVSLAIVPEASSDDWYTRIVWTNLYKVSPRETGNPSTKLVQLQRAACLQLLAIELEYWNPRCVLFLTGLNWARPFLHHLGCSVRSPSAAHLLEGIATRNRSKLLVAPHPQGKPEGKLVREIVSYLSESDRHAVEPE